MLVKTSDKTYKSKYLTPTERIESLAYKNFKPTGDREADKQAENTIEETINLAKNE